VKTTILLGIAVLCPLAALTAQEIKPFDAKPGLWESTSSTEISGMPSMAAVPQLTPEQLARIPEAQRKQVEAMMASRGGGGSPRSITTKSCVTKESLAKSMAFVNDNANQANCTRKIINSSSDKIQFHMECTPDKLNMTMVGDMTIERLDAEHVKGSGTFKNTGTGPNSDTPRTMESKITFSTKWLSSDCGDVKPIGEK